MIVKFRMHYVARGELKARVSYHVDGRIDGKKCVTIYEKDWCRTLGKIFKNDYKNETDSMTDYFDEGRVTLYEDNIFYAEARKIAETIAIKKLSKHINQINKGN